MNTIRARRGLERGRVRSARSRPAAPRRRPDLRVVERRHHAARRRAMGVVAGLASIALFVSLFGLAIFHTYLVENQRQLDRLDAQITKEERRTEQLRLQSAQLGAPSRIMKVAVGDLGMVVPHQVVTLPPVGGSR